MAPLKVAIYIYPSADILDFSGPAEIYSMMPVSGTPDFTITSFAHTSTVGAGTDAALTYVPSASFAAVSADLEQYDILVVPGAAPERIDELVLSDEGKEMCALLRRFVALPPRAEARRRVLQSVCTGALILGAAGVLAGRRATTHHMALGELERFAERAAVEQGGDANAKSGIQVVRERWVDAGMTEAGVRIINAAGVTSGIDTSLWVVEQLLGKEKAGWIAELAEFERRDGAWMA
jgi:transcriptional regulator GlxA family with amidase domain